MATCRIRNTDWHYVEKGQGLPLVLVHGFPLDHRIWKRQVDELVDCCRVIAVDLKGFGKSASTEAFTMESQAEELHQLLQQIGALPCVIAGLSMGGYIALAFAEKYGSDVKGLALVDSKAEADSQAGKEGRQKMADLAMQEGAAPVAAQMMPKVLAAETFEHSPQVVKELQQIMESVPPITVANASYAMRDRADRTALLPTLQCPGLVVLGESDVLIPVSVGEKIKELLPKGELAVVPRSGHIPCMEQPGAVSQVLRQFMVRCQAA